MVLTLFVVPSRYLIVNDITQRLSLWLTGGTAGLDTEVPEAAGSRVRSREAAGGGRRRLNRGARSWYGPREVQVQSSPTNPISGSRDGGQLLLPFQTRAEAPKESGAKQSRKPL
jgi:hypothetical protein